MKGRLADMGTLKRDYRDEDLALFRDMRRRERKNFLLPSTDDSEASAMSTPTRTGRELLAVDSEKNDYDWLLTPPGTPLFPSLDQDGSVVNLSQRRVLSRSASATRTARLSNVQEPLHKVVHCENPSWKLPSTLTTSSTLNFSRGRPSSPCLTSRSSSTARSSSPRRRVTSTQKNSAVSCRSSSRFLTPTLQRDSTSTASTNRAGLLSGQSRVKSLSPKLGPWEPSLPGFSAETPPNVRTLMSDRTIQRGVASIPKNKPKTGSSSADMFDASCQSQWHLGSSDGSRNLSSSYSINHNSSQNSRASVISYDDDVEAPESVLSSSINSDVRSKCANMVFTTIEGCSLSRPVLPAKRHMKSAGSAEDGMPFLSVARRKSYQRQTAQRRSAQAMFRPLLSSAPVTSFYSSRKCKMHLQLSESCADSFTAPQNRYLGGSRNDDFPLEAATSVSVTNANCVSVCGYQQTKEEENGGNSNLEGEATVRCQGSCRRKIHEERLARSMSMVDNSADGYKRNKLINAANHLLTSAKGSKDPHLLDEVTCVSPAPCLVQASEDRKEQPEDTNCVLDLKFTNLSMPTDCHGEGKHTHQEKKSCFDDHALSSILKETVTNSDFKSSESKVEENFVDDQKLSSSEKAHGLSLGSGNVLFHHGAQRVLSDLGSFRKRSSLTALHTLSHDSLPFGKKNGSWGSLMSDSHMLTTSLSSAVGSGQLAELESTGCSAVGKMHFGPTAIEETAHYHGERVPHALEIESPTSRVLFCPILKGAVDDASENDVICEGSGRSALPTNLITLNHSESPSVEIGSMGISSSDGSFRSSGNPQAQTSTSDEVVKHHDLSRNGSCMPGITMVDEHKMQYGNIGIGGDELSRRFFDTWPAAAEASNTVDLTPRQAQGWLLSKRSVTLEEATDTILVCSSVVHELVYKAAALAIENKERRVNKRSISRRDFVALFGFSEAENKRDKSSHGSQTANRARNCMPQPLTSGSVRETSTFVQKQSVIHRQTLALTLRQNPMERTENAVVGNHGEMHTPKMVVLPKIKIRQRRRSKCRCSCCMM